MPSTYAIRSLHPRHIPQVFRKRTNQNATEPSSNLELIASVLPSPAQKADGDELDGDTEDVLRDAIVLLLRFVYAEAQSQLKSTSQEIELLRSAPPEPAHPIPSNDPRMGRRSAEDDMWRLDAPVNKGGPDGKGPLLDPQGKVSYFRLLH